MANIKKLKANGQDIVPITHEQAVLDSNGVTLDSKLNAINNAISRLENNSTSGTPSNPSLGGNTTIITMGNYTIKYNETDDTLDFIYNGATDVPVVPPTTEEEIVPLTWAVGNLSGSNGSETEQANSLRSSFAAIEDNYDYSFYLDTSFYNPSGVRVYFYDTNKTYISRTDGNVIGYVSGTDISIDVPTNAAYMRFKANASGTTSVDTIGSLFTLRKRKTAIVNNYVTEGLSLYIDTQDVVTQGSIRDISGKQSIVNHGVSTTLDNGCLNFVASESDYIDCGFKPNLTQWSAEAYFYFTATPTEAETLLGWGASGNRTAIGIWGGDFMIAINGNVEHTIMGTKPISLTHLVLTYNNGTIIAYVNGVKSQVATNANVMSSQAGNLMIGTKYSTSGEFGNIHLKSLRFYDGKVLTDEEALQNYNYEIKNNYVTEGLSLYIDAQDVATQGSIRDITGNQTITNNGVSTTLDNNCLNFVASESDYIDTGLIPNLTTWTMEAYFYYSTIPTDTSIICGWGTSGNKVRVGYGTTANAFIVQTNNDADKVISNINDMAAPLHHLLITMNNGVLISYLDGIKTELSTSGTQTSHTSTLKLGCKYNGGSQFADMHLKTFRFYDGKVLTDEEALQNYNYELRRNSSIIKPTWIDNKKPDSSTGQLVTNENNACTEFIAYDNSYNYTLAIDTVEFVRVFYYDSSQSYIKNDSIANNFNGMITPPENTAYMRLKVARKTVEFADLDNHVIFKKALAFVVKPTWTDGQSISGSTGETVVNTEAMSTNFIQIDENYNYTISYTNVIEVRIASYDNTKAFISRSEFLTSGSVDSLIEFPANATYFKVKFEKNGIAAEEADNNVILKAVSK